MKSILVVDDEIGILDALDAALREEGYRTYTAPNGRAALDLLEQQHIDLVLLDYMMPVLDGAKTLEAIREKFGAMPVIMLSAISEETLQQQGIRAYTTFFRKPFDLIELLNQITALITASPMG